LQRLVGDETNESAPNTHTDRQTDKHTSVETSVDAGKGDEQATVRSPMKVGELEEALGAFKAHWRLDWITAAAFLKVCEFVHICVHLYPSMRTSMYKVCEFVHICVQVYP
jgi:hypothetical protein